MEDYLEDYAGGEVYIHNIKDLIFSLSPGDEGALFADIKNINFNLSGPAKIVWRFDAEKLSMDLSGKSKRDFNQILSQYPHIDSAELTLSPFWRRSIPDKVGDIKIVANYPK